MKVTKFLHTSIPTMPYDKSYDFYTRILGLNMAPRPDIPGMPGAWLGVEGHSEETQVHIIGCDPLGKQFEPTQVHFALQVESLDDAIKTCWVGEAKGRLKPLFAHFEPKAPAQFDYTQLKLALQSRRAQNE